MGIVGGKAYRQHQSFKRVIRERDSYTCQECGKPAIEVHHIIPYRECHETKPDNVRVMCPTCNRKLRSNIMRNPYTSLELWYAHLEHELALLQ